LDPLLAQAAVDGVLDVVLFPERLALAKLLQVRARLRIFWVQRHRLADLVHALDTWLLVTGLSPFEERVGGEPLVNARQLLLGPGIVHRPRGDQLERVL